MTDIYSIDVTKELTILASEKHAIHLDSDEIENCKNSLLVKSRLLVIDTHTSQAVFPLPGCDTTLNLALDILSKNPTSFYIIPFFRFCFLLCFLACFLAWYID